MVNPKNDLLPHVQLKTKRDCGRGHLTGVVTQVVAKVSCSGGGYFRSAAEVCLMAG